MSPAATVGPAHTRASSMLEGRPFSTYTGPMVSQKASNRVFAHLDDIVHAQPDVSIDTPIRTLLLRGEELAKQAETSLDFQRPDVALQDYIKASVIAIELVPRHRQYIDLQNDRGELHRLFLSLQKRINAQHSKFEKVKEDVKANNARSGVKPIVAAEPVVNKRLKLDNGYTDGHSHSAKGSPITGIHTAAVPPQKKPPINPKPEALHGRTIQKSATASPEVPLADLSARFARLRAAEPQIPVQDPRIRTQLIPVSESPNTSPRPSYSRSNSTISRPSGPREMPPVPTHRPTKPVLNTDIPTMPRAPDAIYSPARGPDATGGVTPGRAPYLGRKGSSISISAASSPMEVHRPAYFSQTQSDNYTTGPQKQGNKLTIPDSTTVTASDLERYMRMGRTVISILLVDIRSREQFNDGHIHSPSVICLEPFSLRHDMSAEELGESLVLSPESEQKLYNQRSDFDLVVYYDQSSTTANPTTPAGREDALSNFNRIVFDHAYTRSLARRPMLLVGGLDSWVDLMGQGSLQTCDAAKSLPPRQSRQLGRITVTPSQRQELFLNPISKPSSTSLERDARREQQAQAEDGNELLSDDLYYARTTEDFFRKYPDVMSIQESMSALSSTPRSITQSQGMALHTSPSRPPPALPRQRSSGVLERNQFTSYAMSTEPPPQRSPQRKVPRGQSGLVNLGSLCYINAILQSMSTIVPLRNGLIEASRNPKPVPKLTGKPQNPQFMARFLGHTFDHLWNGGRISFPPRDFQAYLCAKQSTDRSHPPGRGLGSIGVQHDCQELNNTVLPILQEELNQRIDQPTTDDTALESKALQLLERSHKSISEVAKQLLTLRRNENDSFLEDNLVHQTITTRRCAVCRATTATRIDYAPLVTLSGNEEQGPEFVTLETTLEKAWLQTSQFEQRCEECQPELKNKSLPVQVRERFPLTLATQRIYLTHAPNYMIIHINPFQDGNSNALSKTRTILPSFLDIGRFLEDDTPGAKEKNVYDLVAAVHHSGRGMKSGHYTAMVNRFNEAIGQGGDISQSSSWYKCDDTRVTPTASFRQIPRGQGLFERYNVAIYRRRYQERAATRDPRA